ncbi:MAG: CPBP family intramembrane metalloprotease [Gammaproteobacteria bacterium]|nr:CPBP family intramembrane metalloprotease [Gammaproteobacteria bacterium]
MKAPLFGTAAAIAITTAMDATGYSMFSALPLFPLTGFFWYLQKFPRAEMGLSWGGRRDYGWALAYPLLVLGGMAVIAWAVDAVDVSGTDWSRTLTNAGLMSSTGIIMTLITEEGFFRGWLWASLKRAGRSDRYVLAWTTLAFTAWHISAISLDTGFDVPAAEIPVYLVNATMLGAVWGILRMRSGSVLVPALCHALWNGLDYPMFGFGEKIGALGIQQTHLFGPEVGVVAILLNGAFLLWIWRKYGLSATK